MQLPLTPEEAEHYEDFKRFAHQSVSPRTADWERNQGFDRSDIQASNAQRYLGGTLPPEVGGLGWSAATFGLFTETLARYSPSFAALFNVHTMVQQSIQRWGNPAQQSERLPRLITGEQLGAICFTEPHAGSDLQAMRTSFSQDGETLEISGFKKWLTCGAIADVFLVFGKLAGKPTAVLVDRDTPGVEVRPLKDMMGFRAANLADVEFNQCRIPATQILGRPGMALQFMAPYALDWGRLSVAWSCIGMLRACVESASDFVLQRETFGSPLVEHGSIQSLLTPMCIQYDAALLFTLQVTRAKDANLPEAPDEILAAKYLAARTASEQASIAVQLLGARGCEEHGPVASHYRDVKVMEIIEGSNQIIEKLLAKRYAVKHANANRPAAN